MTIRSAFDCCLCSLLLLPSLVLAAGEPPSTPEGLTGSIVGTTVELTWDIPADPDDAVEGYNVYRNNQYLTTVSTNSYTGEVEEGTLYAFSVAAFDAVPRNFSRTSENISLPETLIPDDLTIPPSVPTDLEGSITGTSVEISWTASTDDEAVLGYNVYRNNQYLTTVLAPSYSGTVVEGESYSYYVVAFDVRINFSGRSESLRLPDTGPVDTTIPPSVPQDLAGSVTNSGPVDVVELTWTASTDDQLVGGYNLYRNNDYLITVLATSYEGTVPAGSSNTFYVTAFDFDNNFSFRSEEIVLPEGSGESDPGRAPEPPTGLAGTSETNGTQAQVELSWEPAVATVEVAGYNVYRDNRYVTTVRQTRFEETITAGEAVSYTVSAFDNFDNFSALSRPFTLFGEANRPPFFSGLGDETTFVGESWFLLLSPVDVDGGAAGVLATGLPTGMELIDNGNGTRSLAWTPTADDVGSYDLTVVAFDLDDVDLRTTQVITLTVQDGDAPPPGPFTLSIAQASYQLREGDAAGVQIPVQIQRSAAADDTPITLSVQADNPDDERRIRASFDLAVLDADTSDTIMTLVLDIDTLPIVASQRQFTITASDGQSSDSAAVTVAANPVARDDVYLLIGQSNMVGSSEANARESGAGQADASNLRIRQANVTANTVDNFDTANAFTDLASNFAPPMLVTAADPLHEPVDAATLVKSGTSIGLGLSFAKAALPSTTQSIVLVPAAWSGSGFCTDSSIDGQWNAVQSDNFVLGNTLLFNRALARINATLEETGGILRGILWHQGEADSNASCAPLYAQNLELMVAELRERIDLDARGTAARGASSDVPFVAGTMSRGVDPRGDFSVFNPNKTLVDDVHKNIASLIPASEVSLHDDLVPANGFACGAGSCIHFGAEALREMGVRYFDALQRAATP